MESLYGYLNIINNNNIIIVFRRDCRLILDCKKLQGSLEDESRSKCLRLGFFFENTSHFAQT